LPGAPGAKGDKGDKGDNGDKADEGDAGDPIYSKVDPAYMYSEEDYVNGKVGVVIYFPVTGARPYAGGSYIVTAP
jgi:hypothetical protein